MALRVPPAARTPSQDATEAVLTYFEGRGLAETIRLTLAAAGIAWLETPLRTREDWVSLRASGALRFGQVPLLQLHGRNLVRARAVRQCVNASRPS
jgi:hypothetical protein